MTKNESLFTEAQKYIPGGVNSPVRAFKQVGGTPVFMQSAEGAYLYDAEGRQYIDYINSWGPMILGHRHPKVVQALREQIGKGFSYGTPTELETEVAQLIIGMVPSVEMIRMVSSGTEACMSAIRLARGYTNRAKILKFEGHYHGHADSFLKKAGSGVATLKLDAPGGVPAAVTKDTIVAPFNDEAALRSIFAEQGETLAAIIVEPVAGNMGCVPPLPGYLETLRALCTQYGTVLIFDEVMTGFRLAPGGAQHYFNIMPDLSTFGKIIGGGMPVGAFGGKKEIMQRIAPSGDVYQAGTLSGNPLAMSAGYATLQVLAKDKTFYQRLNDKTASLAAGLREIIKRNGTQAIVNQSGSMISLHFCGSVTDFTSAKAGDNETFKKFFHGMLEAGIYLPPSAFETWFVCDALGDQDIEFTLKTAESLLSA
ncbi:MAG: glutamate-1-semialdehyde 2,1-aminomutase [Cyclobacteriaceae bacterium]|nr:glutamate-1-semialdehyde 2,1-aminomutase [Cyclobacteriaceae bacterium]